MLISLIVFASLELLYLRHSVIRSLNAAIRLRALF